MDAVFSVCFVELWVIVYGKYVSSCRCCICVSCVLPVAVLNSA